MYNTDQCDGLPEAVATTAPPPPEGVIPARGGGADTASGVDLRIGGERAHYDVAGDLAAAKIVLEPIFEADFEDGGYGYRPRRSAIDAVKETHRSLCRGYTDVVDADLSKYFDTIPHADLFRSVARRVVDRNVLRLIKLWLQAPVEERMATGNGT